MSIMTSLFTGVSGLSANGLALSVIGDNIANTNTHGFKSSRAVFGDILGRAMGGGGALQIGRGVMLLEVQQLAVQGTLEVTANPLDMAIEGDGFFIVRNADGAQFYTRAGQFSLNRDGDIVNPEGLALQGYLTQQGGVFGTINVAALNSPPRATGEVTIAANLNAGEGISLPFDITNPTGTSSSSTSITVHDSLGFGHLVTTYFTKTADNTWQWNAVAYAGDVNSTVVSGNNAKIASGTLTFDTNGRLDIESGVTYFNPTATGIDFVGATLNQIVEFNFGDSITTDGGTGLAGTTQFGAPNAIIFQNQDGHTAGSLMNLIVDQNGAMTGIFTNGQVMEVAEVALAKFVAPAELGKMGRNLFAESPESGGPIIGTADTAGRGRIFANSLESSNVDLANEFVKMIAAQRGFQANARVITTTNDLLAELMAIAR